MMLQSQRKDVYPLMNQMSTGHKGTDDSGMLLKSHSTKRVIREEAQLSKPLELKPSLDEILIQSHQTV